MRRKKKLGIRIDRKNVKSIRKKISTAQSSKSYNDQSMFEISIIYYLSKNNVANKSALVSILNINDKILKPCLDRLEGSHLIRTVQLSPGSSFIQLDSDGRKLSELFFNEHQNLLWKLRAFSQIDSIEKRRIKKSFSDS